LGRGHPPPFDSVMVHKSAGFIKPGMKMLTYFQQSRLKILQIFTFAFFNQGLLEKFSSGSGKEFSIKVRLIQIRFSIAIKIAMKKIQSRFDEKISIKVCLKIFNQSPAAKS
jgi:hypothetical protein